MHLSQLHLQHAPGWMCWAGCDPGQGGPRGEQNPPGKRPRSRVPGPGAQPLLCPAAEMLFLLWGSSLCYATRAVPSAFHEPRYMGIALHNELMISAAFHVAR